MMMLFLSTLTNNPLPFMNSNFRISLYEGDDEIETADGTRYATMATVEWSKINMNEDDNPPLPDLCCSIVIYLKQERRGSE